MACRSPRRTRATSVSGPAFIAARRKCLSLFVFAAIDRDIPGGRRPLSNRRRGRPCRVRGLAGAGRTEPSSIIKAPPAPRAPRPAPTLTASSTCWLTVPARPGAPRGCFSYAVESICAFRPRSAAILLSRSRFFATSSGDPAVAGVPAAPNTNCLASVESVIRACSVCSRLSLSYSRFTSRTVYAYASSSESAPSLSMSAAPPANASANQCPKRTSFRSCPVRVAVMISRPGAASFSANPPLELAATTTATGRVPYPLRTRARSAAVRSGPGRLNLGSPASLP
jgi:hypothetical protein